MPTTSKHHAELVLIMTEVTRVNNDHNDSLNKLYAEIKNKTKEVAFCKLCIWKSRLMHKRFDNDIKHTITVSKH